MSGRGIDHLVLPVRDLDAAGEHYGRLGFRVGARNRHPWGTENRIVQFPGTFLELITVGTGALPEAPAPGIFSFGWFIDRFLATRGEGFAMLSLESRDAAADKAAFDRSGIGGFEPFFFERRAVTAEGGEARVAFTLAFAADGGMPDVGFFACQQHEPQNFWNPAFQQHANGAQGVKGVVILAAVPNETLRLLVPFSGCDPICTGARNVAITTPRGTIEAMTPECYRDVLGLDANGEADGAPRLAAFKISAPLADFAERLERESIPFVRHRRHIGVAAGQNFGTALIVEDLR